MGLVLLVCVFIVIGFLVIEFSDDPDDDWDRLP